MKISVIGTGYVGQVTGTCFAKTGITVTSIDNNTDKIRGLKNGSIPIYEPGLETMISRNIERERKGRKGLGDQNNYVFKKII